MLLTRGVPAYIGEAGASTDYFAAIGYPCPPNTNPADHLLDMTNSGMENASSDDGQYLVVENNDCGGSRSEIKQEGPSFDLNRHSTYLKKGKINSSKEITGCAQAHAMLISQLSLPSLFFGLTARPADFVDKKQVDDIINKWQSSQESATLAKTVMSLHGEERHSAGRSTASGFLWRTLAISQRSVLNYAKVCPVTDERCTRPALLYHIQRHI